MIGQNRSESFRESSKSPKKLNSKDKLNWIIPTNKQIIVLKFDPLSFSTNSFYSKCSYLDFQLPIEREREEIEKIIEWERYKFCNLRVYYNPFVGSLIVLEDAVNFPSNRILMHFVRSSKTTIFFCGKIGNKLGANPIKL